MSLRWNEDCWSSHSWSASPVRLSQGDLSQLGRVVMQGGFSVWISHKRAAVRMKELARFKPMQRHLFLYDHALLFCKRRDEDTADRTPFYSFKSCLRVTIMILALRGSSQSVVLSGVCRVSKGDVLLSSRSVDECRGNHRKRERRHKEVWNLVQWQRSGLHSPGIDLRIPVFLFSGLLCWF